MKSKEIKQNLLHYLIYERNTPAITEGTFGQGICDVLAIKDNKFVMEYEIKTSKPDLDSELNTICFYYKGKECKKLYKDEKHRSMHHAFIHNKILEENQMSLYSGMFSDNVFKITRTVPNYFCFVVPTELADYALEKLKNTPYGLIEMRPYPVTRKANKRIHENDVMSRAISRFLYKGAEAHYRLLFKNN